MLLRAFLFAAVLVIAARCADFSDFRFGDPFGAFDLHRNLYSPHNSYAARDVEEVTVRDREPLDPNYQDPRPDASEEKPVLKPKPQKPGFNPSVIPGGVVDIDATGATGGATGGLAPPAVPGSGLDGFGDFSSFGGQFGGGGLFGLGGIFGGVGEFKPWWKGSNVCIEREESTDDEQQNGSTESVKNETEEIPNFFQTSISLSNCQQTATKYECVTKVNNHGVVKTFTVRYKCCYGYERTNDGEGCNKKLELKPLLETIEDLGSKEFKNLIATSGLEERFKDGNYTLFVPTDTALNEYSEKMVQLNDLDSKAEISRRRRAVKNALSSKALVLSHAVAGFVDLSDLVNEEIIHSENNNSTIRINIYPTQNYGRMVTVNCAKITKPDNMAEKGIAHLIDGVAAPATQSIVDILREHPKLSNLRQAFENTDLVKNFKEDGHFTLFAPTNDAFNKLDEAAKQKLLKGDACARSILKYHVTGHTICSSAISGNATTRNVDDQVLNLERTTEDELILEENSRITETDIIATNGVIHLIDTILIPDSALRINDALNNLNLTKFQELVQKAGLVEEIDNFKNSTVFAPSNEAFDDEKTKKALEEIGDDKQKLRDLVLYHTINGKLQSCDMNNNALLQTNDGDQKLRLNLYSTLPLFSYVINKATVNCAKMTAFDEQSCGSVIHEVNKILVPPTKNILELIQSEPKFSTLSKVLEGTEVEDVLRSSNESLTLLAPTDETFASIEEADLKSLREDKQKANTLLKNHVLREVLCCSGVGPQTWGFNSLVQSLSNQHHQVGRTGSHQIRIGRAVVTSCDNLATNGVVHTINNVLFPVRRPAQNFGGFFLLDL